MKHLKTYENFKSINEISSSYMNKAYKKSKNDEINDPLDREIKLRQSKKFGEYINPDILNYAKKLDIDINKNSDDDWYEAWAIDKYDEKQRFYIKTNGDIERLNSELFNLNTLKKIRNLTKKIKLDYKENEL